MRVVIVGNGMAGVAAATALRRLRPDARVTMVSEEKERYYSRPGLMYYMMGRLKKWDLMIAREEDFYSDLNAELVMDRALRIRDGGDVLELASGKKLPFDRLLLATGSVSRRLRVPGDHLEGIYSMYSLGDVERIMERTRRGMRAVVIGGGLLGAELAEVWQQFGLHVTFLVQEPWYFPKGLDETQGRVVEAEIRRHGVELHLNERVIEFRGDGSVSSVLTESGKEVPAEAVGVTIGVEPNVELARTSGLSVNRGIVVDGHLRTSRESVFAAGDCAEIQATTMPFIEQLWYSAARQGEAAARAMCGDPRPYDPGVFYNSAMFFNADYVSIGISLPRKGEGMEVVVSRDGKAARRFVHREGVVTGITSVGAGDNAAVLMKLVEQGTGLEVAKSTLGGRRWTGSSRRGAS